MRIFRWVLRHVCVLVSGLVISPEMQNGFKNGSHWECGRRKYNSRNFRLSKIQIAILFTGQSNTILCFRITQLSIYRGYDRAIRTICSDLFLKKNQVTIWTALNIWNSLQWNAKLEVHNSLPKFLPLGTFRVSQTTTPMALTTNAFFSHVVIWTFERRVFFSFAQRVTKKRIRIRNKGVSCSFLY